MADWIRELRLLAEAEYHGRRIVASLATVAVDGSPRSRMIIIRGMFVDGSILLSTAIGSEKVAHLKVNPSAEMVFWFAQERQQFRLHGPLEIVTEAELVNQVWEDLGDSSRAVFFWPPPGLTRQPGQHFPKKVGPETPPADSFLVLRLRPHEAESLDLNEHPHRRRRWQLIDRAENRWTMEDITP